MSSTDITIVATATLNTTPASSLIEFNCASNLPIKLNSINYPTWYKQIMHLLFANNLVGYVTGDTPCPLPIIGTGELAITNPACLHRCCQDNHVSLAPLGSCSPVAQIVMFSMTTSADAWSKLKKAYANRSRARVISLKERLSTISKGTSGHDYIRNIRFISDELALIGHPVDDLDPVIALIKNNEKTM